MYIVTIRYVYKANALTLYYELYTNVKMCFYSFPVVHILADD